MELSETKKFALEVLDEFDALIIPEIQNRYTKRAWEWIKNFVFNKLMKKPDDEINSKLLKIYKKLHPKFQNIDIGIQLDIGEKLGSPKIPNVGELAKKRIIKLTKQETEEILRSMNIKL